MTRTARTIGSRSAIKQATKGEKIMNYYTQQADLIETTEDVYMNIETGSVDVEGGWDDLSEVVKVIFDPESEYWIEA
jgi:hypothetical protein